LRVSVRVRIPIIFSFRVRVRFGVMVSFSFNLEFKGTVRTSGPITSWQIDGEKMETVRGFPFLGLQYHCRW